MSGNNTSNMITLKDMYLKHSSETSDINEHLPVLRFYSSHCSSVMEIGIRFMVSTWACLQGLTENPFSSTKVYTGLDLEDPPEEKHELAKQLCKDHGIIFNFIRGDDMKIKLISPVDLLFIDSFHIYAHLSYELETFCNQVNKYICFHDVDYPWGFQDEPYSGDFSEYPSEIDKSKRGLLLAALDFLKKHPEWELLEHRTNNHGFMVLRRIPGKTVKIN